MTRLRILLKVESADAYELKAQALNKDPRLKEAGIAAIKFTGDKQYIADDIIWNKMNERFQNAR